MTGTARQPERLIVAISPCPNDTFIFGGWILGQGLGTSAPRASFVWADVEELNRAAHQGEYDVIKVSAVQALRLRDAYAILSCGGAFGLEHGPRLVSRKPGTVPRTIAVPGLLTTATTLLRQAMAAPAELIPMRYDLIVDAVQESRVDAGLLIHESALLLQAYGLHCLLDLGCWWSEQTGGLPLPLGCILGRRSLTSTTLERVERRIRSSLEHARAHPETIRPLIKAMAQEVDETVLDAHIQAYVNDYSLDMGQAGRQALKRLESLVETHPR